MTCTLTIWTDFEVPSTTRHIDASEAIEDGDNALLNLGCNRYKIDLENGSAPIVCKREYNFKARGINPWRIVAGY